MKKLSLDLDKLEVDSFNTIADAGEKRGTVRGHATEYGAYSCQCTDLTNWYSCYGGCSDSGCGPGQKCYTE
jgi:hypothetical protein